MFMIFSCISANVIGFNLHETICEGMFHLLKKCVTIRNNGSVFCGDEPRNIYFGAVMEITSKKTQGYF